MRTFLRAIATVQVWVAALGMAGVVGLYLYRQALGAAWPPLETAARGVAFFTLLALAGGLLWGLADPSPRPSVVFRRRPFRLFLRALALVQLAVAFPLAVAAWWSGFDRLPAAPGRRADEALWTMLVVPAALGLACLGGVLWCAAQADGPDVPRAAPSPEPAPTAAPRARPVHPLVRKTVAAATLVVQLLTMTAGGVLALFVGTLAVFFSPPPTPAVVVLALAAVVGGILWCSNRIALTPAAPVARGSRLVRHGLRVLAAAQIALGLWMGFAAGANLAPFLADVGWPRSDAALRALALLSGAVGLACLGGVLWCVARVAYPHAPRVETTRAPVESAEPATEAPPEPRRDPSPPVRPMRTYLRTLAASLVGTSVVLAIGSAGAAGDSHAAGRLGGAAVWAAVAPVFALLALVGLFLFHLAGALFPAPPRRAAHPVRQALRVVAAVQMGVGGLVVAAAVLVAGDRLLLGTWRDAGAGLVALGVGFVAGVVTCLGGLLWCAVRLAYPEGWDDG